MADYIYADDGKIHTRYSELSRCTAGQIDRVIAERTDPELRVQTEPMSFGEERHSMWAEEVRKTGRLPKVFGHDFKVDAIEQELVSEILPGVVLHSRLDALCKDLFTVVDYKTVQMEPGQELRSVIKPYIKSKQLKIYAYQLGLRDIEIKNGLFLFEVWDPERTKILGYTSHVQNYETMGAILSVLPWVKGRVAMLKSVLEAKV